MKRFLSILTLVLVPCMMFMFFGCANEPTESELDSDNSQLSPDGVPGIYGKYVIGIPESIDVAVGETFIVALESNPTTGYSWQAEFDLAYIKLIREDFEQGSDLIGAGGIDKKEFKALKAGDVKLTMTYKRPWEDGFEKQHSIPIKITPKN